MRPLQEVESASSDNRGVVEMRDSMLNFVHIGVLFSLTESKVYWSAIYDVATCE